ncbi:hypothetical protein BS78_04G266800 [Paspalum vaginatum]|nr:hypothetical protein BS78_04G266800 [Paspalum vaginatum]
MMSGSKGAAGAAVGGKAARACDSCLRRRARWFCAADDAFLCQGCDASVHSANPLARRHERLRLRPTSPKKCQQVAPAWSKRKARTRRPHVKSVGQLLSRKLVVPEEEQLLYRVPTFDRALAELCRSPPPVDYPMAAATVSSSSCRDNVDRAVEKTKAPVVTESPVQQIPDSLAGFGPTDAELREFAADMEALLGQGLDDSNDLDESFYMETLGLVMTTQAEDGGRVKTEPDGSVISISHDGERALGFGPAELKPELSAEVLDMDFTCNGEDDSSEQKASASNADTAADAQFFKKSLDLRLNYEAVIESWGSSPWTDGQRPHVDLDDFWPNAHYSGVWMPGGGRLGGEPVTPQLGMGAGREARVTRYREKRRTRLFAKKIRYEVRKLNAEKRPRMKGRFVKRPAAGGGGAAIAAPCAVT